MPGAASPRSPGSWRKLTRLPLYVIDMIQFRAGADGVPREVPHDEYLKAHADLIHRDEWIIDGFGSVASAWERFAAADTLIHVDLPLLTHYRWVTKRLIKGLLASPAGLAGQQSAVGQHDAKLSRSPALPPAPDAQVPAARRRRGSIKAGSPPAVSCPNPVVPGRGRGRAAKPLRRGSRTATSRTAARHPRAQPAWRKHSRRRACCGVRKI